MTTVTAGHTQDGPCAACDERQTRRQLAARTQGRHTPLTDRLLGLPTVTERPTPLTDRLNRKA